jgi:hypothetical protein
MTTTDTANNRVAFNNSRADASTMQARTEIKCVETGAGALTSDLDLVSDTTSCRMTQTYISGAANNYSTYTTNSTGLQIVSTNSQLQLVAGGNATLQGSGSNVVCSSTAITGTSQVFQNFSTQSGTAATPNFIFKEASPTAVGACVIRMDKAVAPTAGNAISAISSYALDGTATSIEWSRIQTKVENLGAGNQDGTLSIYNSVNGVILETFNFNGALNTNNTFRPLDLNGQALRTKQGDLLIDSTLSSGSGNITVTAKPLGNIGLSTTGNISLSSTGAGGAGVISATTVNGNINLTTTGLGDIAIYSEDTATITGKQGLTLQTIVAGGADVAINSSRKISLSSRFGNTTGTVNSVDLGGANVLTIKNGNELNALPENRIVMTCNPTTTTNNQIELIVNDTTGGQNSGLTLGMNGSNFTLNNTGGAVQTNVWTIPTGASTPITFYRSMIFSFGANSSGQVGVYEKFYINSTLTGNFDVTDNRFGTTIFTPTGALTADISTPTTVGYWWAVCNKSATQTITIRLNGVNQVVIPVSITPTGNTVRVAADTTTSLYLV